MFAIFTTIYTILKMQKSVESIVFNKIKKAKRGTIFFVSSFDIDSSARTINKALERLVNSGELHRITTGMYVRPIEDKVIGAVLPGIESIAEAVAKRDKARIVPTGSYALYKLGLTTQIPLNVVYYTDATARKLKVGKQTINFKRASAKNVSFKGKNSMLAIQALKAIGKDKVRKDEITKIANLLKKEPLSQLKHDLKIAPEWISTLLTSTIGNNIKND